MILINHHIETQTKKMVHITFDICLPSQSTMDESLGKNLVNLSNASGALQDIAYNIVQDRANSTQATDTGTKERTIFVLGSKGVVRLDFHTFCFSL